jgi:hypothetical protein
MRTHRQNYTECDGINAKRIRSRKKEEEPPHNPLLPLTRRSAPDFRVQLSFSESEHVRTKQAPVP